MLKNYLITTLRKLGRQKNYTAINVLGLALGMACCLFIFLIIQYELRFDRFHSKRDRIYRLVTEEKINDIVSETMGSPIPMAAALRQDFPNLEKVTVAFGLSGGLFAVTQDDGTVQRFQENDRVAFVEPEFFEIFDFPWLAGDPKSLAEPNGVALTEEFAQKFFDSADPLGRTIRMDNQIDLKVVGVVKNFPLHTDFPFSVLVSWKTLPQTGSDVEAWGNLSSNVNTFVVLPPDFSAREFESRLVDFKEKYHPQTRDANKRVHKVQPLSEVHYDGRYGNYGQRTTSKTTLWALGLIGVFLLITACINFVNMATAQAINRAKEVGVRKVLGAFRSQLITQYLGETFVITLLGAALAVVLAELLLPTLNQLLRLQISFNLFTDLSVFSFLAALIAAVSLLAGLYPAFVLSRFMPALALKSKVNTSAGGGLFLRRGLVVFQFIISQMLIIGTLIVTTQMDYFRNKEMGFDKQAIVTVPLPANDAARLQTLRAQLLQNSHIRNATFSYSSAASGNSWDTNLRHTLNGAEETFASDLKFADVNYISTYGLKLVAGRSYVESDTVSELVVNETFARKLGYAPHDLVGKMFKLGRRPYMPIVGVVQDFHTRPLQEEIRPCLLAAHRRAYYEASIKIEAPNMKEALGHIEKIWSATFPEFVYSYEFLDERLAGFYKEEQKMSQLFRAFAGIAIFIGCIGLLGLISFVAAQRTKEIGVRKVLGASVADILGLIAKEFALLIAVAFAVAAPVAYLVMNNWLENFAYRIEVGLGVFAATIAVTLLIAGVTIGYRALKAALANPVEALRYE
ncbi:MAG: ABC transporter permease [candidate division KSB1 bacterium]|nr:ABC transporter permease [candidate division KSB1 bacterium]MDZ7368775.1 ABC transporter permease [candidate division KSB1 bacterium]MDZ7406585.1 ABC transporter permease [candidate division KSB1 bacterium]